MKAKDSTTAPRSATSELEFRAREAVTRLFTQRLLLPTIYYDPAWQRSARPDVLAIDRAGVGDVHLIEIESVRNPRDILSAARALIGLHANYLWLTVPHQLAAKVPIANTALANPSGMGRVGLIGVADEGGGSLRAEVLVEAERFAGSFYDQADKFISRHRPDLQYR